MFRRLARPVLTPAPRIFWGLCLFGFVMTTLLFHPGYLTVDGLFQYLQARRVGVFVHIDDWHAPIMAWVWRYIAAVCAGTFGMFALQQVLFWTGLMLISWRVLGPTPLAGVCVLLMAAFPPVVANLAPIWKDIQMGASLMLGLGLLLHAHDTGSRSALLGAQVPLLYGLMLRHNALGALLPLHVWGAAIALRLAGRHTRPGAVALGGAGLLCAHLLVSGAFTALVIQPEHHNPVQYVMIHDLAALSLARGEVLLPPYLRARGIDLAELREGFREDSGDFLVWVHPERSLSFDPADGAALRSAWLHAILANPAAYARHRWRVLRSLLALGGTPVHIPFVTGHLPDNVNTSGPMTPGAYDDVVVGGGFFGCCIALCLRRFHSRVLLLEREAHLLGRASLVNQARVHNGYHYPRSVLTALRSRVNFDRFVEQYADCVVNDFTKLYAVPRRFSHVTAAQFRGFCERIGAPLRPAPERLAALFNDELIESVFEVREYAFDAVKLRDWVTRELEEQGVEVRLETEACRLASAGPEGLEVELSSESGGRESVRGTRVFNSTYARLNTVLSASGLPTLPLKYEVAEMALIDPPEELRQVGVTVMCGPFFSTMPYPSRGLHTLSHVRYTPHGHWYEQSGKTPGDEQALLRERTTRFPQIVKDSARFLPCLARARYVDSLWETKTLLPASEQDDSRPILFKRHHGLHNLYCVMGGKIDNVFDVMHELDVLRRQGALS